MKAYIIKKGSKNLNDIVLVERGEPAMGANEILVRMRAASLNYRDQAIVAGEYFGHRVEVDTVPLSDGAGEVIDTGPGVTRFKTGDRLIGTFFRDWIDGPPHPGKVREALGQSGIDGVLSEHVVFNEQDAVPLPEGLSFEEAACLPCAALTAWNALVTHGAVKPGQTVLTLGTGGVSIAALQFARAAGARVILTSSSDEKLERGRALGADGLINYKKFPEWEKEVLRITGGRGVDHIIEVGGAGTLSRSFQAIGTGGSIALIGFLAGQGDTAPQSIMGRWARLQGIVVGNRAMFEDMIAAITVNHIRPVVDRIFSFDEALDAYRYELAGKHFGKVVIKI